MKSIKQAIVLRTDGTFQPIQPVDDTFSLEELQKIVGGYIQVVMAKEEDKILVINEEGKLNGLPINERATKLYQFGDHDQIVGNALLCDAELVR